MSFEQSSVRKLLGQKYSWKLPDGCGSEALDLANAFSLSIPIAQAIVARGFTNKQMAEAYMFSSLKRDVHDPEMLKDSGVAVDRILSAIRGGEKILIFGDYDVDGMTSTSLLLLCLIKAGAKANFFLPNRIRDGYGISSKVVERAAKNGYSLIITVDNGVTAFEAAQAARELGIDLIITDHHKPHEHLPDAVAVIDPCRPDCEYPYKKLAGVGVIFKITSLLYQRLGLELPHKVYELLMLGTVADVVPLTGENRFWVRHGLGLVSKHESYSVSVMKRNVGIGAARLSSMDIAFGLAPQLNAIGRLDDPRQAVKFLIGADRAEIDRIGDVLLELNQERKTVERAIFNEVKAEVAAGRIDPNKDGLAKGSCRSIEGFDIFTALQTASHLLGKFGGHPMAAGLSLPAENLQKFKDHMEKLVSEQLTAEDLEQKLELDADLSMLDVNKKFVSDLEHMEPFGSENREPAFYLKGASVVKRPILMKELHVKCSVFADGVIKPVIFFNRPELFEFFNERYENEVDLAVKVVENSWNGRTNIELGGIDVAVPSGE